MSFNLAFAIARKRALRTSPCSNHDLPTRPRPGNRLLPFALFAASFFTAQLAYAAVPVADGQTVNINEDDAATPITLTGSDSDLDPVTFNAPNTSGLVGSLTGAVPNLSYAPPANYNGTTSFTFTVTAGGEDSPPATVTINVASINDIPVADDKPGVAVDEDDSVDITLTGSDPVEGSGLTFSIASSPSDGQISGTLPNVTYTPNPNFDGSDSFTYVANDGDDDSNPATVTINVTPVDDPPTSSTIPNQNAAEAVLFSFDTAGFFSDVDSTLSYSASGLPGSLSIAAGGANRGRITGTPTQAEAQANGGVYNVTVSATDSVNPAAMEGFTLTIAAAPNQAPVANNQSPPATNEDTALAITLTATDGDDDTLTYSIVGNPTNGALSNFSANAGTVTYTPNLNYNGPDSFTFRVNDGTVNSNTATISISVNPQNDTPTTTGIGPQGASEGSPFDINVSGSFDDADGDTLTYSAIGLPASLTITASGGNRGRIAGTPTQADADADVGNGPGVYTVTVTAEDPSTASVQAAFTLTVGAVNEAPVANNQVGLTTNEDSAFLVTLTATDGDGDALTYAIVGNPANGTLSNFSASAGTVTYTPNQDYNGGDSFTFRANDGTVDSNLATISITVDPQNDPPTTTGIGPQSASEGVLFSLNTSLSFDDADGDTLTYSASGLPASMTPINLTTGVISGTPTQAEAIANGGVYNVTVTASDPSTASVAAAFTLTIGIVNDAPVAVLQNVATDEDNSLPIILTGTDNDGDPLTFAIVGVGPTNGVLVGTAPDVTYTPNLNYNGADSFSFTVNDGVVTSAPAVVNITVNPVNDLPLLVTEIPDQQAVEAAAFSLNVAGNFDDPDGEPLTYAAIGLPASLSPIDPATGVIDGIPTQAEGQANDGVYTVTVTATDSGGESVVDSFQLLVVTLDRANVALIANAAPTPAMLNDQVQFNFIVSNIGPASATGVSLDGSFVGSNLTVAPTGATTCTIQAPVGQTTNFSCMIGDLPLGAVTSLSITATAPNAGAITVFATAAVVAAVPIDPDLVDNSTQLAVGVGETFSNGAVQILGNAQILSVAHGDVNGDGFTDIVLGTTAGVPAQVYLSSGFRDFSTAISVPDNSAHQGVALADFDRDNDLDIVLANAGVPDTVYRNDGIGNFVLMATLPGATFSNDVAAGDFNNDNNMDILIAATGGNPLFVGNGSGAFTLNSTLGTADSRAVEVGHLSGNDRLDAVFANVASGSTIWRDIGFAANAAASQTFTFGDASSVVIAELIGTANANAFDLAFGRIPTVVGDLPENLVLSNNGSGAFALSQRLGMAPTNDILAGDVNRDGLNDLVFINDTGVHQIWNRSGGTFVLHTEQIVDDNAVSGILTDLGDLDIGEPGGVDLAMGGNPAPGAAVYLNDGLGNLGKGDITAPVLALNGDNPLEVKSNSVFNDPRATATDNIDGDISTSVVASGSVNTAVLGNYIVTYNVTDAAGNAATPITRTVTVVAGTGTGGGGSISPFTAWLLLTLLMVLYTSRRVYISKITNKKNQ